MLLKQHMKHPTSTFPVEYTHTSESVQKKPLCFARLQVIVNFHGPE